MSNENGGPAFPLSNSHKEFENTNWQDANGMTLRDYFAAKIAPVFFDKLISAAAVERKSPDRTQWLVMAEACYGAADAMLEARK